MARPSRRTLLIAGGAAVVAAVVGARFLTAPKEYAAEPVFTEDGLAIRGYDPVAYFTEGAPQKGDPAHSYEWKGATWHFASAENRDAFAANPEKYAPKYGGYCAYAVAKGKAVPADPDVWTIVEGELYLNLSPNVRKVWQEDMGANITAANNNWPEALVEKGRTKFDPGSRGNR